MNVTVHSKCTEIVYIHDVHLLFQGFFKENKKSGLGKFYYFCGWSCDH